MKSFLVALALIAVASAEPCEYPHKGDGGVLDSKGNYITGNWMVCHAQTEHSTIQSINQSSNLIHFHFPLSNFQTDSVLVFVDVANNAKNSADNDGDEILESQWIDASERFNKYMEDGDTDNAFKMLRQANQSFKNVAPHIEDAELSAYFIKVNKELEDLLDEGDFNAINTYMRGAYPQFKEKIHC